MTAPACPRLAAELTNKILEVHFTDEIPAEHYRVYIWVMSVLLDGGWMDMSFPQYDKGRVWLTTLGFWDALQPWLTDKVYTDEDILAHLVDRELFGTPRP